MKFLLVLLPAAATVVATQLEQPAEDPTLGVSTVHGCYSSVGELQRNGTLAFNSQGSCATACIATGAYVAASQSTYCYCGDKYPPASTLVDDSKCDEPCPGFAENACGGSKAFTVYNTGVNLEVEDSTDDSSSSKSSTVVSSSSFAISTSSPVASTTSVVTATPTASGSAGTSGSASVSSTSPTAVATNGAVPRLDLGGLNMAILSLGTVLLM